MQMLNFVNVLIGAGYNVTVCCYYEYDESMVSRFEKSGAEVLLLKYERAKGLWHLAKGLMRSFKTINPDIVHVQYIASGLVTVLTARLAGIKTVYATVHQPGRVYGLKEKLFLRTAARLCTAFFCVSRSVEGSWFGDSELFDPQNVNKGRRHFTVYNGVDAEKIAAIVKETDSRAIKNSLSIDGKKVVGFTGRLRYEKGLDILIDAMPEVLRSYPDTVLIVIGDGPDRMSLEQRAESLGMKSQSEEQRAESEESREQRAENGETTTQYNILWLGQKTPEEVYQLYSIMDVVAVPSLFEGFGLVAAEAQAAGLPVVAARIDGLTEIMDDGVSGYLVETGNSMELSGAIMDLFSNPEKARNMGMKGQESVREHFSIERFGSTMLGIYKTTFKRG